MARTMMTKAQQAQWIEDNRANTILHHAWSTRGYGSSRIINDRDDLLAKSTGCGYDRFGDVIGKTITALFPNEINMLAKRECKGERRDYKKSEKFYGLFYNSIKKEAWLDGGCGIDCMKRILNKIGFSLQYSGATKRSYNGEEFYRITPLTDYERRCLK